MNFVTSLLNLCKGMYERRAIIPEQEKIRSEQVDSLAQKKSDQAIEH